MSAHLAYHAETVEALSLLPARREPHGAVGPSTLRTRPSRREVSVSAGRNNQPEWNPRARIQMGYSQHSRRKQNRKASIWPLKYIPAMSSTGGPSLKTDNFYDASYSKHPITKAIPCHRTTDFSSFYNQRPSTTHRTLKDGGIKIRRRKRHNQSDKRTRAASSPEKPHWGLDRLERLLGRRTSTSRATGIITRVNESEEPEELWTGEYVFEKNGKSFRAPARRTLELQSIFKSAPAAGCRRQSVDISQRTPEYDESRRAIGRK